MIFESGVRLFKDVSHHPEWHTSVTGTIIAKPKKSPYRDSDTLLFSYDVVEDKEVRDFQTPLHKNQFYHEGGYYWRVDDLSVLGVIRDGELIPDPRYLFLEEIEEEAVVKVGLLYVPTNAQNKVRKNRARVLSGEMKGATIVYNDRYAQKYTVRIENREVNFIVLPKQYLAGLETD